MRELEQITEWANPKEMIAHVKAGASYLDGQPIYEEIPYLKWCRMEAKRLRGVVRKVEYDRERDPIVVAVFA